MQALFRDESAQLPSWLTNALLILVAFAVFAMMALVFANVFGRYVLSKPIAGGEEVIKFLMALDDFWCFPGGHSTWRAHHRIHIRRVFSRQSPFCSTALHHDCQHPVHPCYWLANDTARHNDD